MDTTRVAQKRKRTLSFKSFTLELRKISLGYSESKKVKKKMSEKEKMKSEEIAKVLAENPTAKIYLAGLAQGMKLAKSMEPEAEQPTPAGKEAANE